MQTYLTTEQLASRSLFQRHMSLKGVRDSNVT